MPDERAIAYFSMEIALDPAIPTYSGGLGVLAGDTIRAAADLKVPMVAVTLLYRQGYFTQRLDANGVQREEPAVWSPEELLHEQPARAAVTIEGRTVQLRAWTGTVTGATGFTVPVYFLDANLPENAKADRGLTDQLYGGDPEVRLSQEIILGMGGIAMLRALGYHQLRQFHMNEGHASLLTLSLLDEEAERTGRWIIGPDELARVRRQCVFTTHTPVPAGHDEFPTELVTRVLGRPEIAAMPEVFCSNGRLNLTYTGLHLSHYVNGVARRHGEVSRKMFASEAIDAITNGVHAVTWTSPPFQALFDRYIPTWREDNASLRHALIIPLRDIWQAHEAAKQTLIDYVHEHTDTRLDPNTYIIGFARRVATYKRADLLFHDLERLKAITKQVGRLQVIYAGKAHPHDQQGKELIRRVFQAKAALGADIPVVFLENYNMTLGKLLTSGADVWLNTPLPPLEASGTSGMKAALNGVPSLSMLDGWWVEGHIEGITGWAIGDQDYRESLQETPAPHDAESLYTKLERVVLPLYYQQRDRYIDMMRHTIALNGSFFNTQRMVQEYVVRAYFH